MDLVFTTAQHIVSEHLSIPLKEISLNSNLIDDLKVDSLQMIEIIMIFEEKFEISILSDEIDYIYTIQDLIDHIPYKLSDHSLSSDKLLASVIRD